MLPAQFAVEGVCAWESAIVDRPVCDEWNSSQGTLSSQGKDVLRRKGSSELMLVLGPGSVTGWRKQVVSVRNLCGECISHCLNFYESHNNS